MADTTLPTNRTSADDRKLKNILIAPSRQFKFAAITIAIGLVTFFGFFGFELWLMSILLRNVAAFIPPESNLNQLLSDSLNWSWAAFVFVAFLFSGLVLAATIIISHRLYGPIYAMRKHVAALARGEYSHRTHLRKEDEFKDLAKDLNDLSKAFESRSR